MVLAPRCRIAFDQDLCDQLDQLLQQQSDSFSFLKDLKGRQPLRSGPTVVSNQNADFLNRLVSWRLSFACWRSQSAVGLAIGWSTADSLWPWASHLPRVSPALGSEFSLTSLLASCEPLKSLEVCFGSAGGLFSVPVSLGRDPFPCWPPWRGAPLLLADGLFLHDPAHRHPWGSNMAALWFPLLVLCLWNECS